MPRHTSLYLWAQTRTPEIVQKSNSYPYLFPFLLSAFLTRWLVFFYILLRTTPFSLSNSITTPGSSLRRSGKDEKPWINPRCYPKIGSLYDSFLVLSFLTFQFFFFFFFISFGYKKKKKKIEIQSGKKKQQKTNTVKKAHQL